MCCFQVILLVKHGKTSLPKNRPQMSDVFHDVSEGQIPIQSGSDNENSTSSYIVLNDD